MHPAPPPPTRRVVWLRWHRHQHRRRSALARQRQRQIRGALFTQRTYLVAGRKSQPVLVAGANSRPHLDPTMPPLPPFEADQPAQAGANSSLEVTCTRDCEVLSEELKAFDGRYPISVSTLRRFFNLIPKQGNFSKTTLNTGEVWDIRLSGMGSRTQRSSDTYTMPPPPLTASRTNALSARPLPRIGPQGSASSSRAIHRRQTRNTTTTREFEAMKGAVFSMYGAAHLTWPVVAC